MDWEYSDGELVKRAVTYPVNAYSYSAPRWSCVKQMFGVGSTVSHALCRRFQCNPDDLIKGVACDAEEAVQP